MLSDDLEGWDRGWDEVQEGEEKCIQITDALHCTGETNTTLQSNYTPIKINLKKDAGVP
mgnify:CR=1 FL=1